MDPAIPLGGGGWRGRSPHGSAFTISSSPLPGGTHGTGAMAVSESGLGAGWGRPCLCGVVTHRRQRSPQHRCPPAGTRPATCPSLLAVTQERTARPPGRPGLSSWLPRAGELAGHTGWRGRASPGTLPRPRCPSRRGGGAGCGHPQEHPCAGAELLHSSSRQRGWRQLEVLGSVGPACFRFPRSHLAGVSCLPSARCKDGRIWVPSCGCHQTVPTGMGGPAPSLGPRRELGWQGGDRTGTGQGHQCSGCLCPAGQDERPRGWVEGAGPHPG